MRSFTKGFLKLLAWLVGILLVFVAVMRIFFVDVAVVGHNAMAPTMEAGDSVLIWRNGVPEDLGDIAVCNHPENPGELVMGRVVGKGGMRLESDRHSRLSIAGSIPDIDWQGEHSFADTVREDTATYTKGLVEMGNVHHLIFHREGSVFRMQPVDVPPGKVFLMSDNRMHPGQDSRYFGPVDPAACQGTVFMRLAPAEDSPNDLDHAYLDIID